MNVKKFVGIFLKRLRSRVMPRNTSEKANMLIFRLTRGQLSPLDARRSPRGYQTIVNNIQPCPKRCLHVLEGEPGDEAMIVQLLDFWIAVAIMDMDTDPGSSSVSTLATQEANQSRQKQRFESETPEEREDRIARQRACRRERIASETAEQRETRFTADRARRKRRITSEGARQRYASLDAALEVLSKLLRSTIRLYATEKSARRH